MKTHETMFVRDVARTYDPEVANVISESNSLVRADTFAAVIPRNHRELKQAISELGARAKVPSR